MCTDCEDNSAQVPIGPTGPQGPSGPTGPTGPTGPSAVLSGMSSTSETIGTGIKTFTTGSGISYITGQTLVATSISDNTKSMAGTVVSYIDTTLRLNVTDTTGSGTASDWIIGSTGLKGNTGATGSTGTTGAAGQNAYSTVSSDATPLGGNSYTLPLTNAGFTQIGQYIFVQDAGTYLVTNKASNSLTVLNPGYSSNVPANLLIGKTVTPTGIKGDPGTNGTNGFIYETIDGNGTAATSTTPYSLLMRNDSNTGYIFVTLQELKTYLASI